MKMGADQNVFAHRQADKRLNDLKGACNAASREAIWRLTGNVLTAISYSALVRFDKPGDDRKQRRLAGAIRADECGDASLRTSERRGMDPHQTAESTGHAVD